MNLAIYKKIYIVFSFIFIFGVACFLFVSTAMAQTESFSFEVYPKNPAPQEVVRVNIKSFSVDLDRAHITWTVDENTILSGIGEKSASIKTKNLGEVTLVKVVAVFAQGQRIEQTLVLQPAYLDILWESTDSYIPPFYKGKALPSQESTLKVVAIPEIKNYAGQKYKPEHLIYTWKKGIETQTNNSGFNKQYFSFKHNVFDSEQRINIEVSSQDGYSGGEGSALITFSNPRVAVYQETSQKGINFASELSQNSLSSRGKTSLVAIPYFFSTNSHGESGLSYQWTVNGNTATPQNTKNKITLEKTGEDAGLAEVEVSIKSVSKLFQDGLKKFNIELQ